MESYHQSVPGRMLAFAAAVLLATGAVLPFSAEGVSLYTLPIIGSISIAIISVGLGVSEHPYETILAILVLPVALFLYVLLVGVVVPALHAVVYPMAVGALLLSVVAARPGWFARPTLTMRLPRATRDHG
jgi:hypothetical protein